MPSLNKVDIWNRALSRIGETKGVQSLTEDSPSRRICETHYEDVLKEMLEQRDWPWATKQTVPTSIDASSQTTIDVAGGKVSYGIDAAFSDPSTLTVFKTPAAGSEVKLVADTDYTVTLPSPGVNGFVTPTVLTSINDKIRTVVSTDRVGWDFIFALPADYVSAIGILSSKARFDQTGANERNQFEVMPNNASDGFILCTNLKADDIDAFEYVAMIDGEHIMPRHFVNALVWRLAMELSLAIKKDVKMFNFFEIKFAEALSLSSALSQNEGHSGPEPDSPTLAARG